MSNLRESRQSRDIDSNGVHTDKASVDDIEGCYGNDNAITDLENDPFGRLCIQSAVIVKMGLPHKNKNTGSRS